MSAILHHNSMTTYLHYSPVLLPDTLILTVFEKNYKNICKKQANLISISMGNPPLDDYDNHITGKYLYYNPDLVLTLPLINQFYKILSNLILFIHTIWRYMH